MATRANIKLVGDGKAVWLYKHWDGNPEEVLPQVKDCLKRAKHDIEMCQPVNSNKLVIKYAIMNDANYKEDNAQRGDIEYLYKVNVNTFKIRTHKIPQPWN